jgi:hypothetical protein
MTGRERRCVASFLTTVHDSLMREEMPLALQPLAIRYIAYHTRAVAVGLETPECNITLLVREHTDALKDDIRELLVRASHQQ